MTEEQTLVVQESRVRAWAEEDEQFHPAKIMAEVLEAEEIEHEAEENYNQGIWDDLRNHGMGPNGELGRMHG